jgi:hypothetical protein
VSFHGKREAGGGPSGPPMMEREDYSAFMRASAGTDAII